MDEDDGFFDDDFGDLPSATLLELEQQAIATQRSQSQQIQEPQQQEQHHHQQEKNQQSKSHQPWAGRAVNPPVRPPLQRHSTSTSFASASGSGPRRPAAPGPLLSFAEADLQNFDAGTLDDGLAPVPAEQQDVVILDQQAEVQQTDQHGAPIESRWPGYQPGFHAGGDSRNYENTEPYAVRNAVDDESRASEFAAEAERLREQIEQLTRDRSTMLHELDTAKSTVDTRAGEIAIVRANQAKQQRDHESQVTALRAAMAEQVRKHQAEIEATAMESKRVTTENAFLKQDLREENFRTNEKERTWRAKQKDNQGEEPVTPRKARNLPFRDGFDDDEIMASPSKSGGRRSGRGTPSVPGKRKRKAVDDSPRESGLQLSQSFENNDGLPPADLIPVDEQEYNGYGTLPKTREDRSVRFMRSILNHRTYPHKQRDLEVFASLSFPSQPDRTFSSYILEATASSHPTGNYNNNYAVSYAKAIISLWSRCILEKLYSPISMFMGITKFILNLDMRLLAPPLIADLVPVLRESAYVNGLARFRNSPNWHQNRGQAKQTPLRDLHPEVDGSEALEILYTIATSGCMDVNADDTTTGGGGVAAFVEFWTRMRFDFILMMLNPYQPIRDIVLTLNILSSSIQPRPVATTPSPSSKPKPNPTNNNNNNNNPAINSHYTFGPLHSTTTDQTENENYILDRAANLLSATPSVDQGQRACTPREITGLRLEVMYFLTEVAFSTVPLAVARRVGGVGAEEDATAAAGGGGGGRGGGAGKRGGGGLALLASHRRALACIFRSMHDELDALYAAHAEDERAMHAELVNGLTRLAYGVLHAPSSSSLSSATDGGGTAAGDERKDGDTPPPPPQLNLHAVPGAVQKHLVVLTRLAFSERGVSDPTSQSSAPRTDHDNGHHEEESGDRDGDKAVMSRGSVNVFLEAGIEVETVEMAHEMLEEAVNPQEAEALVEVFRPGLVGMEE